VAEKVGKLLRLLSSPNDGEVLGAARALLRTLTSNGLDVHTLAERVERNGFNKNDAQQLYQAGFQDGLAQGESRAATFSNIDGTLTWHEMAVWCAQQADRLRDQERKFVDDMAARTVWCEPTKKQAKWLKSIHYRLGGQRR
jgi:hypothetical protein